MANQTRELAKRVVAKIDDVEILRLLAERGLQIVYTSEALWEFHDKGYVCDLPEYLKKQEQEEN